MTNFVKFSDVQKESLCMAKVKAGAAVDNIAVYCNHNYLTCQNHAICHVMCWYLPTYGIQPGPIDEIEDFATA